MLRFTGGLIIRRAGFALSLPWMDRARRSREVEAARSRVDAQQAEMDNLLQNLRADIAIAWLRLVTLRHHDALNRGHLLPQRERTVEAVRAEFAGGRRGLKDVLDARRMWLDDQLMAIRHQAAAFRTAAELDELLGGGWIREKDD